MQSTHDRGIVLALIVTDAAFLWLGRPKVATLATNLAHPHRWVAAAGSDGAAATLAQTGLWLCALWVALAVLSVTASRLPGAAGRLASAVAGRAVPAVIRGSIAGAVGASIFLAPLAAGAATPGHARVPVASSVSLSVVTPARTATSGAESSDPGPRAAALDAGSWAWPTSPPGSPGSTVAPGPTVSPGPTVAPGPTVSPVPTASTGSQHTDGDHVPAPVPWPHDPAQPTAPSGVVVQRGDSLWAIAAHRLGPQADAHQIATVTGQWFEANRPTIGSDPSLIQPGQHLHAPSEKGHRS